MRVGDLVKHKDPIYQPTGLVVGGFGVEDGAQTGSRLLVLVLWSGHQAPVTVNRDYLKVVSESR